MSWQSRARVLIAVAAVSFAVVLAFAFRTRPASEAPPVPLVTTDPEAIVESEGGQTVRIDRDEETLQIDYERLQQFADGRSRMIGVTITSKRDDGRTLIVVADEGEAAEGDSAVDLRGDVKGTSSDGLELTAQTATYLRDDGSILAPGHVAFSKGRTSGTGTGLDYNVKTETLRLQRDAIIRVTGDGETPVMEMASGSAEFRRLEHVVLMAGSLNGMRQGQKIAADEGVAYLGGDNEFLARLELRGNSRIAGEAPEPGDLESMSGRDIDLEYRDNGETLDEAVLVQNADIRIAGAAARRGRRVRGNRIEFATTVDGSAPRVLYARGQVRMDLPAERGGVSRNIQAASFDGDGDENLGITSGRFSGGVVYQERADEVSRTARSQTLAVSMAPGLGDVNEARFEGAARFEDGAMIGEGALALYHVADGRLELRGGPASAPPRLVDARIQVEAASIDVAFEGPHITANGDVKSELKPQTDNGGNTRRPSMLDDDTPVLVVSDRLVYDGGSGRATYEGRARLSQGETTIRADTLDMDEKTGNMNGKGAVATTTMLEQVDSNNERRRVPSIARSTTFVYDEASRKATYETGAQVSGPQGDMKARLIELFLKESGNELERVEAYDEVTLNEERRRTTGTRLTYFSEDARYLVLGEPVRVVDGAGKCRRETVGRTLTFFQSTDRVIVDGNEQMRTRTTGATRCP